MSIIYALVSRDTDVLAEYTSPGLRGNFSQVTRVLLKKIPPQDGGQSYLYDKYVFHYIVADELTYLCMADTNFSRDLAFQFVDDIQRRFVKTYGDRGKTALAFAFNADFERVLQSRMDHFNSMHRAGDKISQVNDQLAEVKNTMIDNIDKVLERGERIELLVDRTDELDRHAFRFNEHATTLRRTLWWKNVKLMLTIGLIVLVVLYIILVFSCGGFDLKKCR